MHDLDGRRGQATKTDLTLGPAEGCWEKRRDRDGGEGAGAEAGGRGKTGKCFHVSYLTFPTSDCLAGGGWRLGVVGGPWMWVAVLGFLSFRGFSCGGGAV